MEAQGRVADEIIEVQEIKYWIITFYIAGSVPGHIGFLVFGSTAYFDFFPWQFSVMLLFVHAAIIAYFFSLKPSTTAQKL